MNENRRLSMVTLTAWEFNTLQVDDEALENVKELVCQWACSPEAAPIVGEHLIGALLGAPYGSTVAYVGRRRDTR